MKKMNTAGGRKRLGKLITSIRQKAANDEMFDRVIRGHSKLNNFSKSELLEFLGERQDRVLTNLTLLATRNIKRVEEFVVGEKFLHRQEAQVGIKLYIWESFQKRILNPMLTRKVKLSKNRKLNKLKLLKNLHDTTMQTEVGHKPFKVAEFIPVLWSMISEQKNGEEGFLLTNGYANIFHVQLEDGSVVAVDARWFGDGWRLSAYVLVYDNPWGAGGCLFALATA